jgi:Ca2+-binding EF-hand superfamily protein
MPLGRWQVPNAPEKQLEEFLASKPEWIRRYFQKGMGSLNQDELVKMLQSGEIITLTSEFERILQQIPDKWKAYRKKHEWEAKQLLRYLVPKAPPGRKRNDALAERIWAFRDAGKTSKEIREILEAGGESCSQERVESYFKARRRTRGQ